MPVVSVTKIRRNATISLVHKEWAATHEAKTFFIGDHFLRRMQQKDCLRILNEWGFHNQKWSTLEFLTEAVRHKS